jgi:hypothetical protein
MAQTRVEFKLSMPGKASWNGKWSGESYNHTRTKRLGEKALAKLMGGESERSWSYRWDDGWCACVTARVVPTGEKLKKSDGFAGYDWMISSIMSYDDIYADHEIPKDSDETSNNSENS